ncbi:unnamed protein product [Linum trigynum]|uniref:Uncharacterized protein n=1 Tax=Linum trigynum TaxID=586398 RepID=A0AAV2F817_9ROSI
MASRCNTLFVVVFFRQDFELPTPSILVLASAAATCIAKQAFKALASFLNSGTLHSFSPSKMSIEFLKGIGKAFFSYKKSMSMMTG